MLPQRPVAMTQYAGDMPHTRDAVTRFSSRSHHGCAQRTSHDKPSSLAREAISYVIHGVWTLALVRGTPASP
jgi:hypothetical protein